jgi:hypothetical protein
MNPAYLPALAALAGSAVGGLTSLASAWLTQFRQDRAARLSKDKARRQKLYWQFIDEASKLYADALVHEEAEVSALVSIYALISRMRILSSAAVIEKAEVVIQMIIDTYFIPNKTFAELQKLVHSNAMDPLRAFADECREELSGLQSPLDRGPTKQATKALRVEAGTGHLAEPAGSPPTRDAGAGNV